MRLLVCATALAMLLAGTPGSAQWLNYPAPGTPRTRDGKPNLSAPAPRASNGKPDLSGVWHVEPTPIAEQKRLFGSDIENLQAPGMEREIVSKYGFNILLDVKDADSILRPATADLIRRRQTEQYTRPGTNCLPLGFPLSLLFAHDQKIVQTPGLILMMIEEDSAVRQVYTDGRKLPADPSPSWMGYSIGKWEGDTLVVETNGLNDKVWLDAMGHPRSESMHITERYHRRDFGHLDDEITFDDPVNYTLPFTVKLTHLLQPDTDILEYICAEGEKDRTHMKQ